MGIKYRILMLPYCFWFCFCCSCFCCNKLIMLKWDLICKFMTIGDSISITDNFLTHNTMERHKEANAVDISRISLSIWRSRYVESQRTPHNSPSLESYDICIVIFRWLAALCCDRTATPFFQFLLENKFCLYRKHALFVLVIKVRL